jgi:hypothetical protein
MRYFAFYHGFKLVQRIRWFFTIYRIIYFVWKRKMLFPGLRLFFWPLPFKTREFIPIMNLKCILHACAGKTVQHHAKILLGCCENFQVSSGSCLLHFPTHFFTLNNLFKKHKNMRLHIVFLGIFLNRKKQFF